MALTPQEQAELDELHEDLGMAERAPEKKQDINQIMEQMNAAHRKDVGVFNESFGIGFGGSHHGTNQFWNQIIGNPESAESKETALLRDFEYQKLYEQSPGSAWSGKAAGETLYYLPVLLANALSKGKGAGANLANAGAQGMAIGASQYVPEGQSRVLNALTGLTFGMAPDLLIDASMKAGQAVKNTMLGSPLEAEDLLANLAAAQGTETSVFQVMQNPWASKWYENTVTQVPGSGGPEQFFRVGQQMEEQAEDIIYDISGYKPDSTLDLKPDIERRVISGINENEELSEELYSTAGAIGDEAKVKVSQEPLGNAAKKKVDYLNKNPSRKESLKRVDSGVVGALEQSAGFATPSKINFNMIPENIKNVVIPELKKSGWSEEAINKEISNLLSTGKQRAPEDFSAVNDKRGDFLSLQRAADEKGKGKVSAMYGEMAANTLESMEEAAIKAGKPEVINSLKDANKFFADTIIPMRNDTDISQYAKDTNLSLSDKIIESIIRGGKGTDYANQIKKFEPYLGEQGMKELIYSYFNKATNPNTNKVDVRQVVKQFENLGPNQRKALMGQGNANQLSQFKRLVDMNPKALSLMYNPETGASTKQLAVISSLMSMGASAGGWLGAALAVPLASSGASSIVKQAGSDAYREQLIHALIKQKNNKKPINNDLSPFLSGIRPQASTAYIQSEPRE